MRFQDFANQSSLVLSTLQSLFKASQQMSSTFVPLANTESLQDGSEPSFCFGFLERRCFSCSHYIFSVYFVSTTLLYGQLFLNQIWNSSFDTLLPTPIKYLILRLVFGPKADKE